MSCGRACEEEGRREAVGVPISCEEALAEHPADAAEGKTRVHAQNALHELLQRQRE